MRKIKVFISSAMRELECEREIAEQTLKEMTLDPILFELFPALSQSPFEAYIEEVKDCDIFIMILWKTLKQAVFEEYEEALRRNKPILILIKSPIENEELDQHIKDFLNNLTLSESPRLHHRTVYKYFRKVSELKSIIRDSIMNEIAKFYKDPIHTLSREEMYELGTSIVRYAQKRICLYQKTPSLFLGARNYLADDENKFLYEKTFLTYLEDWIEQNYKVADKELLYLFSLNATKKELQDNEVLSHSDYIETLKDKVTHFKTIEKQSGYRFRFIMTDMAVSGPLIVGDNRYAIWLLGGDDAVSISQENEKISDILVRMFRIHTQKNFTDKELFLQLEI